MKAKNLVPAHQGDLDSLCGIYSVVNLMYWLYGNKIKRKSLFKALVLHYNQHWPIMECLTAGIDSSQMDILLQYLQHERHSKYRITVTQPFRMQASLNRTMILRMFQTYLMGKENRIILMSDQFHWSVVTHVDSQNLYFFDSCGCKQTPRADYSLRVQEGKLRLYPEA
ncbi:hypothetical protein ATS58_003056, partial [Salmonella enterica subsp. enterica serovar Pensacola]|nr:hypothetical protein [Salmonella enterica subsp. enterica serovar Pensacola]